jgi:hypothetical protein
MNLMGIARASLIAILVSFFVSVSLPLTPAQAEEVGGFAIVHPDGHVCGVIVGSIAYFGGNDRTMESEFMGCPIGARIIFQTRASETGNVAGYHGTGSNGQTEVTYDANTNSFAVANNSATRTEVTLVIKDGIATDSSGRSFNTGTGVSAETKLSPSEYEKLVSESQRIDRAINQKLAALNKSKDLALQTPGLERCVDWQGSLEQGTECSTATEASISETDSKTVSSRSLVNSIIESQNNILVTDSSTASSDTVTATVAVKPMNEFQKDILTVSPVEITGSLKQVIEYARKVDETARGVNVLESALNRFDAIKSESSLKKVALPTAAKFAGLAKSDSPTICKIEGNKVVRLQKGACEFSYTFTSTVTGNSFTVGKSVAFK